MDFIFWIGLIFLVIIFSSFENKMEKIQESLEDSRQENKKLSSQINELNWIIHKQEIKNQAIPKIVELTDKVRQDLEWMYAFNEYVDSEDWKEFEVSSKVRIKELENQAKKLLEAKPRK